MSDFLASIAARAAGTESGILPRQPARFEPYALPGDGLPIVEYQDVTASPAEQSVEMERASTGQALPVTPREASSPDPILEPTSTTRDREQPFMTRNTSSIPLPGGPPAWSAATLAPASPPPAPDPPQEGQGLNLPAASQSVETIREPIFTEWPNSPRPDRTFMERLPGPEQAAPARPVLTPDPPTGSGDVAQTVLPTVRTTVVWQERSDGDDAIQPMAQLRPASLTDAGERAPRTTDSPPPPTIHVTIGRVEIRAPAIPPHRASRPTANPAVLPLNEYLRRHKGGA